VLFSMAVIELAKPGQEATTYELLISIANASSNLASIVSTQLLFAFSGNGCTDDDCDDSDEVDLTSVASYEASNGPYRYTLYTLCLSEFTHCTSSLLLYYYSILIDLFSILFFFLFMSFFELFG